MPKMAGPHHAVVEIQPSQDTWPVARASPPACLRAGRRNPSGKAKRRSSVGGCSDTGVKTVAPFQSPASQGRGERFRLSGNSEQLQLLNTSPNINRYV